MSVDANRLAVRHYIEEVVNTGNIDKLAQFISEHYTETHEGKRYPLGIDGAREHVLGVRQRYPDLTLTIDRQIADGERIATGMTARSTHRGEWMGIRPNANFLTFTGVNINRIRNGRIIEYGGAASMLMPLLEAGAIRIVGSEKNLE